MNEPYDQFKTILEENTHGHKVEIRYAGEALNSKYPAIRLFEYTDYPKNGLLTTVTYGISYAAHDQWNLNKPEFMLTVNSKDLRWPGILGLVADLRRDKSEFKEGYCCCSLSPIVESSKMQGLCFGGPVNMPINPISLSDRRILIRMAFPIYLGEIKIINNEGVSQFIQKVGSENLTDIMRQDLSNGATPENTERDGIDFIQIEELGPDIAEEKRAMDKFEDIITRCRRKQIDYSEFQKECLNLTDFEKKILEETTVEQWNAEKDNEEKSITLEFLIMMVKTIRGL